MLPLRLAGYVMLCSSVDVVNGALVLLFLCERCTLFSSQSRQHHHCRTYLSSSQWLRSPDEFFILSMKLCSASSESLNGDVPHSLHHLLQIAFEDRHPRPSRSLDTQRTSYNEPSPPYNSGAKVLGFSSSDLEDAPLLILSDTQLASYHPEISSLCKLCAKSIALVVKWSCIHTDSGRCQ